MAKRVIEKFVAELSADKTKFNRDLKSASTDAKRFGEDIGRKLASAAKIGGVALAAAAAGAAVMVNETRKSIDAQAKFADSVGISTEALAGLEQAAAINGATNEGLRKGLERLVVNVNDFKDGIGEAVGSFEKLGISVDDIRGKSPDEMFALIGDKLGTIPDQAERAAIAYEIFGRQGIKLIKTLEVGSEGLKKFQEEADTLGLSLSRVDAAQVEAANDALTRAGAVSKGFANRLTVELAPAIESVATMYLGASLQANGFADTASIVGDIAEASIGAIGDSIEEMILGWKESKAQVAEFAADLLRIGAEIDEFFSFGGINKSLAESAKVQKRYAAAYESMGKHYREEFEKGFNERENKGSFSDRFADRIAKDKKELEGRLADLKSGRNKGSGGGSNEPSKEEKALLKQFETLESSLKRQVALYGETGQAAAINYDLANGSLSKLNQSQKESLKTLAQDLDLKNEAARSQKSFDAVVESLRTEEEALKDSYEKRREIILSNTAESSAQRASLLEKEAARYSEQLEKLSEETNSFADEAARNLQDAFADFLFDPFQDGVDGMLQGFADMLMKMVSEAVAADVLHAIGLGGKDNTGGNVDSLANGALDFFGGFFAEGGRPDPNKVSIVGEKGPELHIPDGVKGTILPMNKVGGNTTNNITFVAGPDRKENNRALGQLHRQLNQANAAAARVK